MSDVFELGRRFFGAFDGYDVSYDEDVVDEGDQVIYIEPHHDTYLDGIDIFNIGLPVDTLVGVFVHEDGPVLELYKPPSDTDE